MEKETQMTMSESLIFIPDDILVDIFSRLPAKSVLRLRWACKYWFDLIINPDFVKMHLHRSTIIAHDYQDMIDNTCLFMYKHTLNVVYSVWNFRDLINNAASSDSSPLRRVQFDYCNLPPICIDHLHWSLTKHKPGLYFRFGGSCNGLIFLCCCCPDCEFYSDGYEYFLWNPSTRELKHLPFQKPSKNRVSVFLNGFGYDHTIDDYKVINIIYYHPRTDDDDDVFYSEVSVYTLGSNSWSTRNDINQLGDFNILGKQELLSKSGLFFNGVLHWKTSSAIFCFDIVEEEHRVLQQPNYTDSLSRIYMSSLQVLNGCLCVVNIISEPRRREKESFVKRNELCVELWMMKDYGVNESWIKLVTIGPVELDAYIYGFTFYWCDLNMINLSKDGEILMVLGQKYMLLYDLKKEKPRWVHKIEDHSIDHTEDAYIKGSYIGSLVSLKSGTYLTAAGSTTTTATAGSTTTTATATAGSKTKTTTTTTVGSKTKTTRRKKRKYLQVEEE